MDVRPPTQKVRPSPESNKRSPLFLVRRKLRRFIRWRGFTVIITLVVVAALAGAYFKFHKPSANSEASSSNSQQQLNETVTKVGKLILLPSGEQPTLAVISDASKFSGQAFFAHAQNGDKILVYAQAREAILYRPSINKIIQVAPLSQSQSPGQ